MGNKYDRRKNESFPEWKERLYRNRKEYSIEWEDINTLLEKEQSGDHTRKGSYGYLECLDDLRSVDNFDRSVMIINDIHTPYERDDVLELIKKHANEINTLVIAGDLMDCESISKFPKKNRLSIKDELIYTYNFVSKIRKILDNGQDIIIHNGNHEERWYRDICDMHSKGMQDFLNPNILDMLFEGFTLYENGHKVKYKGIDGVTYIPHWYINLDGKLIVCHPKDFSSVDGKMCEKVSEHFLNKHEEFEVVVFGHTHKYSQMKVSRRQGIFVVENNCLCKPHDYADCGKLGYTPQDYGYTIVKYNNDEPIDYNNIKVYFLDEIYDNKQSYRVNL